jgi:hypothetical protein
MPLFINYRISGTGWVDVTLSDGQQQISGNVSYIHDSLGNLADAAVSLLTSLPTEKVVVFMDEPGEHQLILTPVEADILLVELRWYNDWASWNMYPQDRYDLLFKTESTVLEFATIAKRILTEIWVEHGYERYLEKWVEHPFPNQQYNALLQLLGE